MKKLYLVLGIALIIIGGTILLTNKSSPPVKTISPSPTTAQIQTKNYTLTEIANHKDADNCWMTIEGKVYDVSSFIASGKHKGGMTILDGCGKDATELFNNRPGTGTPHSAKAREMLVQFFIGNLSK